MAVSATAAVLLGATLLVLIFAVTSQRDAARRAFRSQEALTAGSQLEKSLLTIENGLRGYIASGRARDLAPVNQALGAYHAELTALARLVSHDPGQQARTRRIGVAIDDYAALWARPLIALAKLRLPVARSVVVTDTGRARLEAIRADFARLFRLERTLISFREHRAEQFSSRAIALGSGGLALVLAVAAGVALYLRRSVVRPVLTVAEATGRLASGELSARVPAAREDELGDLARGFNSMADSLEHSQAELERSNTELTRSNAELEQFASVTSHDLQAPLTTISMYSELLERRRRPDDDDDGLALVDGIRDATHHARALIRDLLEYSRAGRGRLELELAPAAAIVGQALERLAGAIEASGARVTVGALPVVRADRTNLTRVFQNLVGNAVKFTAERRPVVSIEAEREGDAHWRFSVRDNGIGMDPEQSARIFEPFRRLHGEEAYPGTGIGLAVCERIVDQHGGRIWFSSELGEGSVFHFTLPAVEAADEPAPESSPQRVRAEV